MRNHISWLRSIKIYRVEYDRSNYFVVADWCGWIPGRSKSRFGAFLIAYRAAYGKAKR